MDKKSSVRCTDGERQRLPAVVRPLQGTSEPGWRAQRRLKAEADGPHGQDAPLAEAFNGRVRTLENGRQRWGLEGLDAALEGAKRTTPPTPKRLAGAQAAQRMARRVGKAPGGEAHGTVRGWAQHRVARRMTPTRSYETIRDTLKNRAGPPA